MPDWDTAAREFATRVQVLWVTVALLSAVGCAAATVTFGRVENR